MKRKRKKTTLCCSKKILVTSYIMTAVLTLCAVLSAFLSDKDIAPIVTLAGLAWGETTAANAFYFWKAKSENKIKLTNTMVVDLADKYGIDAVVSLAGITLSD